MTTKSDGSPKKLLLKDVLKDPKESFLTQIKEQKAFLVEQPPLLNEAALTRLVSQLVARPVTLKTPLLQLSARKPYDAALGVVDMYMPGRWDATSDLMFMDPIVHPDPNSPGVWTGSAGYIEFKPPSTGTYLMLVNFFGWQVTMSLNGPAGTTTAVSNSNSPTALPMLFSGTAGQGTGFSFACTGLYLGFVQSIQAFQL
jgi:hypothetical protein